MIRVIISLFPRELAVIAMAFEKDFLRKLYGHCDDETFAKFFSTYITDPVLGKISG